MVPIPVSKPTLFLQQHLSWYWYLLFNQSNRKSVIKYKPQSEIVQKQKTLWFLFQICFRWIDRLRNISKNTTTWYVLLYLTLTNKTTCCFLLLLVISRDTEHRRKSCPRRYPGWPQKESWETSWEVPKAIQKRPKSGFGPTSKHQ